MGSNGSSQMAKPPIHIVNLEELLFTFVKRKILKRRKRERLCLGLTMYLEVGWNYVDFIHEKPIFDEDILINAKRPNDIKKKNIPETGYEHVTLFSTKFVNNSEKDQSYTFRAERKTKSSYSFSIQKGYTLGTRVNLEVPTKIISALSGGLSGQLSFSKTEGGSHEETLTWSVDRAVNVEGGQTVNASLVIRKEKSEGEVKMITTIKSLFNNGKIPVMLKKKRDDTTVAEIGVDMQQLVHFFDTSIKKNQDTSSEWPIMVYIEEGYGPTIKITTEATCKAVHGVEQEIIIDPEPGPDKMSQQKDASGDVTNKTVLSK